MDTPTLVHMTGTRPSTSKIKRGGGGGLGPRLLIAHACRLEVMQPTISSTCLITGGGWARSANFMPHQHFSDSARVLQHGLNTVNLHRYHLSSVGSFHQHHSFHQTGKPTFSLDSINRDRFRTTP